MYLRRWNHVIVLICLYATVLPKYAEGQKDARKKNMISLKKSNRITIDGDKVRFEHLTKNRSKLLITPYRAFRAPVQTVEHTRMQSYFQHTTDTVTAKDKTERTQPKGRN